MKQGRGMTTPLQAICLRGSIGHRVGQLTCPVGSFELKCTLCQMETTGGVVTWLKEIVIFRLLHCWNVRDL